MVKNAFAHKFAALIGAIMIIAGVALGVLAFNQLPSLPGVRNSAVASVLEPGVSSSEQPESPLAEPAQEAEVPPASAAGTEEKLVIALADGLPSSLISATTTLALAETGLEIVSPDSSEAAILYDWNAENGEPVYRQFFAAATRFDTIDLNLRSLHIERAWRGNTSRFVSVAVLDHTLPALIQLLGKPGDTVVEFKDMDALIESVTNENDVLALVPFDRLEPRLAVYSVDGQTPVENAAKFNASAYPLVATVYAHLLPNAPADALNRLTALLPTTNRNPSKLTVVAMTGVTAMVRFTAAEMDKRGPSWPAEVVGPELAAADITAISNEVPFVPDCETNDDEDNLVFCSKPEYMETLRMSGADIIGLTGNHQNDYGYENALVSLEIYKEEGLQVYGGGADKSSAMAPLYIEHNGNKLAFLGANSYGPVSAWATDFNPGSAPFDLSIMSAAIRSIKESGDAHVVLAELQYQESYDVTPLYDQRLDFGALARAGADIVTGVQSHVPQAVEFVDGRLILYGLGNLYFDQMWDESTREGLIVKHTIYEGRHISTQLLPTLLFDYGQPRWPDAERRAAILAKVFGASVWD
jgi:hypothetical protein